MIAFDTNVLARAILGDDPAQSRAARAALAEAAEGEGAFVPAVVLIELAWVLDGAGLGRPVIASAVEMLLSARGVTVEQPERARAALSAYVSGAAQFADFFIAATSADAGCRTLLTFDRKLARDRRATLLGS